MPERASSLLSTTSRVWGAQFRTQLTNFRRFLLRKRLSKEKPLSANQSALVLVDAKWNKHSTWTGNDLTAEYQNWTPFNSSKPYLAFSHLPNLYIHPRHEDEWMNGWNILIDWPALTCLSLSHTSCVSSSNSWSCCCSLISNLYPTFSPPNQTERSHWDCSRVNDKLHGCFCSCFHFNLIMMRLDLTWKRMMPLLLLHLLSLVCLNYYSAELICKTTKKSHLVSAALKFS